MRQMADRGYVVVSMDYTLSSREQPTWDVAADYGGDPARFLTYGESAGGQLLLDASYDAAASALSAHGVWNQHLLDSMTTFFAEHGADA